MGKCNKHISILIEPRGANFFQNHANVLVLRNHTIIIVEIITPQIRAVSPLTVSTSYFTHKIEYINKINSPR